jgi:diguanylate cyclase (GGDEF)-like protein
MAFAKADPAIRATVVVIDLDRFKQVNDSVGIAVGDSILLTLARRLGRLLKPQDTLARLNGDQFAFLLLSETQPERVAAFAESVRRTLRAPITLGEKEIFLTASIGIASHDQKHVEAEEMVKDAEIGMYHAKRLGGDRIEAFRPALRQHGSDLATLESDLRRALGREEIKVLYQPIVRLEDKTIAGFEGFLSGKNAYSNNFISYAYDINGDDCDDLVRVYASGPNTSNAACPCETAPRESPWGTTQRAQKEGLEFGRAEYDEIDAYCREQQIDWFASAWDVPSQHFLGSAIVDTKTNEIPVARELFKKLDLDGRKVSLDALHTQDQTAANWFWMA